MLRNKDFLKQAIVGVFLTGLLVNFYYGKESPSQNFEIHAPLQSSPLTSFQGREKDPTISYDGKYVVWVYPGGYG